MTKRIQKPIQVGDRGWVMGTHAAYPVTVTQVTYNTHIGTRVDVQLESGSVMPLQPYLFLRTRKQVEATMRLHINDWREGLKRFKESANRRLKGGGNE